MSFVAAPAAANAQYRGLIAVVDGRDAQPDEQP
jgi:hypothetical protein